MEMIATNLPPEAAIESALTEVKRALAMLQECQARQPDADIDRCTMHHVQTVNIGIRLERLALLQHRQGALDFG